MTFARLQSDLLPRGYRYPLSGGLREDFDGRRLGSTRFHVKIKTSLCICMAPGTYAWAQRCDEEAAILVLIYQIKKIKK
jgi:hypothetical protein